MTADGRASLDEMRDFHAKMMAAASNSSEERLEQAFRLVRREAFMGPGPWQIRAGRHYLETPNADPTFLYQNVLVALDKSKGINNGEPFLHAAFLGAVAPQPGETVIHIGTGTGYYTAILSTLVTPGGHIHAVEIDEELASRTRDNLASFENISVHLRRCDDSGAAGGRSHLCECRCRGAADIVVAGAAPWRPDHHTLAGERKGRACRDDHTPGAGVQRPRLDAGLLHSLHRGLRSSSIHKNARWRRGSFHPVGLAHSGASAG